jgi:signal transduction histidine kinase
MIELQAAARRIDLEWQPKDPSVIAAADRYRVEQILLNLLSNAIKYTEPGGRVTVGHRIVGDRAILEVSDTGLGIPDDRTEEIFELFTQIGGRWPTPHDGAGLGLPISRGAGPRNGWGPHREEPGGSGLGLHPGPPAPRHPFSQPSSQ